MRNFTAIMTKDASNTFLYMDINYIVLLDCSVGEVIKIRLSAEEKIESEKYGFNLNCCSWMSCEVLSERSY